MLFFLLLCLLNLTLVHSIVISLPDVHQNQTVLPDLPLNNLSVTGSHAKTTTASRLSADPIDTKFGVIFRTYPNVKISGKSTYMNILKAMIKLSYSEGTDPYMGETFFFHGYANVRIRITRGTSSSTDLQYRYAIWALFKAANHLTVTNMFSCIVADLYWSGSGTATFVGQLEIFPDPLPNIVGSKEIEELVEIGRQADTLPNLRTLANITYVDSNETNLASPTNAGKLSVFLELQGPVLSIPQVFRALFSALVHIASFRTAQLVRGFQVQDRDTMTELVYQHYGAPRTSSPYFVYHDAARALGRVPEYMFAQHKFEAVTFVLEIDGTPVGTGYLRKSSSTSSVASQKV